MLTALLTTVLFLLPMASPGPKAGYCFEKYYFPELAAACDSTCGIVDCGAGRCPTCPIAGNIFWHAWASYKCDDGKGMFMFISAIGKRRTRPFCVE